MCGLRVTANGDLPLAELRAGHPVSQATPLFLSVRRFLQPFQCFRPTGYFLTPCSPLCEMLQAHGIGDSIVIATM